MEPFPRLFFDTLMETDSLHVIFPEVYKLKTALEAYRWHPEGNSYEHTMLVLTAAAKHNQSLEARVAALAHDFGKALTPRDKLPKHHGHEVTGVPVAENFTRRLAMPAKTTERVAKTTRFHMHMQRLEEMNAKTIVSMFMEMGAFNDPAVVHLLHDVGVADHQGRLGSENAPVDHLYLVVQMFEAARAVKFADVFPEGETNVNKIKDGLFKARVQAVKAA
jgi:tRNA nucleotidyltransferase (CCA-adding enzyme)